MLPDVRHIAPPYCYRCPLGKEYPSCAVACADELENAILAEGPDRVAFFIAEPVMGAGGVIPAPKEYWTRIRQICDKYDVLMVADEVITGAGRTGKRFACEHWDVRPDIISCAKGISGGYLPLGAVIVLMLWFYFTGLAVLVGGEVNSLIEQQEEKNAEGGNRNSESKTQGSE